MKIRWNHTFELDITDKTDGGSHIETIEKGYVDEIDIVNVHDDEYYVDIQFGNGSMAYCVTRDSFTELPETMTTKDYYGSEECPECHEDVPVDAKVGDKCSCGHHTFVNTFKKITVGYVVQEYKTLPNGTHVCTGQEFIAGEVTYESTEYGDGLDNVDTTKEVYCPFDMTQPLHIPFPDS